jgi:hypothetical protein
LQHSTLVHVPEQFPEALNSDNVPEQLDLVKFDTHVDEADGTGSQHKSLLTSSTSIGSDFKIVPAVQDQSLQFALSAPCTMQVALVLAVPGVNTFPSSQLAWVNVHSVQEDCSANENCPAGQSVQDVVAPGENFPAGQIGHKPPVPALPGRQGTQVPVSELMVPPSHTLEEGGGTLQLKAQLTII